MERKHTFSGAPWEQTVGYCRAVRMGNSIAVSGTVGLRDGQLAGADAYTQTRQALLNIQKALEELNSKLADVVRTRMYVVDIQRDWQEVGRAHQEFFGDVRPATTMVEVRALIDPQVLVEIEADAICG